MVNPLLDKRQSGVLLHISSLPGGKLGQDAFDFIDFLASCHFRIWQLLPLCPPHTGGSPYDAISAFAGHTGILVEGTSIPAGYSALKQSEQHSFNDFCSQQGFWLDDFALYQAIKNQYEQPWTGWPVELKKRAPSSLEHFAHENQQQLFNIKYAQYQFFLQWSALREYAKVKGILLFGDMPIFVAHDSADCWAHQELFQLDDSGQPTYVTGVPPDYFSETGQRWGNPHYDWQTMQADNFSWWQQRVTHQLKLYDLIRIDHFRGFSASWKIPANEETAIGGFWEKTPGYQLFDTLLEGNTTPPIIAEDLGIITEDVESLRDHYEFPGMKILQFAFDGKEDNPYLPENIEKNSVVYTGTHDNNTSLGWFNELDPDLQSKILQTLELDSEMPWPLIETALACNANTAIIPMQDLLELNEEHRMNIPGTIEGNWQWKFHWPQINNELIEKANFLNNKYR